MLIFYRLLKFLLLFSLLLLLPTESPANDLSQAKGPSRIRNQYPLEALRLTISPDSALTSPEGTFRTKLSGTWSNTYNLKGDSYRVDAESREVRFEAAYSLSDNFELSGEVPLHWRGRGILDNLIDEFHKMFSFPRAGRNDVDDYLFDIYGMNKDGSTFVIDEDGFGVGNPVLSAKWNLSKKPLLTLTGSIGLPAPTKEFGQQSVDLLAGLLYSTSLDPFFLHFGASYIFLADDSHSGVKYQQHQASGFGTLELPITPALSIIATAVMSSPTIKSIRRFPDYSIYLDTGLKWALSENWQVEALVRENPSPRFGTTDVTVLLGLEYTS